MSNILQIDQDFIERNTVFSTLIQTLKQQFSTNKAIVPMRHHHDFPNPDTSADTTLLLMPAWNPGHTAGVKVVTVNPVNHQHGLPAIQGSYIYFNAIDGTIKAIFEAKCLTVKRTAATSALAASYLSRSDAQSLLMIGTGALAPNLIKAHASVRPIKDVFVWGRNFEKAKALCEDLQQEHFTIKAIKTIEEKISDVAIISCATLSKDPLVLGKYLKPGQHVDLVGAYKKDMREADDETITKGSIFVDTFQGGLKESGDIVTPIQNGILREKDIKADLFSLTRGEQQGRINPEEITVFKSVGHALEDLAAADYYYKKYVHE